MRKFWNWKNSDTGRTLYINGGIACESWYDDDVTPALFKKELNSSNGAVTLWINSNGGDCIAAAQIYNMMKEYPNDITVKIDGIAASAASVIAMAGTKIYMSPVAQLMIHNPSTIAWGDHLEMKKTVELLDSVKESIINAYEIKTKLSREEISDMMDKETWMDANKALELGFIDGILGDRFADFEEMPQNTEAFQKVVVQNTLQGKIARKCLITGNSPEKSVENQQKQEPKGRTVTELQSRLDLMKKMM